TLVGSFGSNNPRGVYGGIQGFSWLLMLALFFATGSWLWFLVGAGISAILGAFTRPILAGLGGLALFGMARQQPSPQSQPPYYQPPQQEPYTPPQPAYQGYQEGYQPETYQEGGQQHPYPQTPQPPPPSQQYEQPQAQYPQQMPPQQ
ncbi:MAG TPA: hypothetical protein VGT82_16570, partial [Ktedonobacteraceae bacterium]|nr:hypothetical protein [Ktedonobacteraceae bacterium]